MDTARGEGYTGEMIYRLKPVLVTAVRYSGTSENIRDLEAHFGTAENIWEDYIVFAGQHLVEGQWLVQFADSGEVKVYSDEAFRLCFEVVDD